MTEQPVSGEDIARVVTVAQEWLRTQVPHMAPVDERGQTCSCPLCRVVAAVRDVDPDTAATWLSTALSSFTSTLATYAAADARTEQAGTEQAGTEQAAGSGGWIPNPESTPTTVVDDDSCD